MPFWQETRNNFSFCSWTFLSEKGKALGHERSQTLDPTVASTQHSLLSRPPSGICHQCYRKQLLAGLWENGKRYSATNATVFFKNFCFPESFANPASAPASVCQAVWLGILAETWGSAMPNLLSPVPGLLATHAGVMQRGSPWELTAAEIFLWRFEWSAACMSQPRSLEVMGIGQVWWAHWLFYRPLRSVRPFLVIEV